FISLIPRKNPVWNLDKSLKRINRIFERYDRADVARGIQLMLGRQKWHPQLVACIAMLKLTPEEQVPFIKILWKKLRYDKEWTAPQMAVILSMIDPRFKANAYQLLDEMPDGSHESSEAEVDYLIEKVGVFKFEGDYPNRPPLEWRRRLFVQLERTGFIPWPK
ncbi:MAG: hypothetical protein AAFO94_21965, partial [Bacteroidota bacterium]